MVSVVFVSVFCCVGFCVLMRCLLVCIWGVFGVVMKCMYYFIVRMNSLKMVMMSLVVGDDWVCELFDSFVMNLDRYVLVVMSGSLKIEF